MKEINISLNDANRINTFLNAISRFDDKLFIKSGKYTVNAKSPIGICTCDLSRPVTLMIQSNAEIILPVLESYIAK